MADDWTGNGSTGELELEAKRIADCSWHPCQVYLRSSGGLTVRYKGQDSEDIIFHVKDAFACLRVRSAPLQGDDCCYIEEGKQVLAAYEKNSKRLFFDAVVEKAVRVRHSKRACCRCTFMIKWLFDDAENETLTLPSGSIMKLAAESIKSHPVVAAFLRSVESPALPSPTVFDEGEFDLHGLLGRQIEEIGTLADLPEKEILKDASFRRNNLRRSTRAQNKMETKTEDLITYAPSSVEESRENRSPLTPLAARAVLASLVSKLPQKIEFVNHKEGKQDPILDYTAHNHVSLEVTNGMMMFGGYDSQNIHNIDTKHAKLVDDVESLMKTEKGAPGHTHKSRGERVMGGWGGCLKNETSIDSGGSPTSSSSIRDQESTEPVRNGRLTRSAMKRESGTSNVTFARVTRSRAHERNGNLGDEVKEALPDKPTRATRSASTAKKVESGTSNIEFNGKTFDEKAKARIFTSTTRVTRSTACEGTGTLDAKVKESLEDTDFVQSEYVQKSDSEPGSEVSRKKKACAVVHAELKSAESNKKPKRLSYVERKQKTAVEDLHSNVDNQSQKKSISSKNRSLRFSPRLRFPSGT